MLFSCSFLPNSESCMAHNLGSVRLPQYDCMILYNRIKDNRTDLYSLKGHPTAEAQWDALAHAIVGA